MALSGFEPPTSACETHSAYRVERRPEGAALLSTNFRRGGRCFQATGESPYFDDEITNES